MKTKKATQAEKEQFSVAVYKFQSTSLEDHWGYVLAQNNFFLLCSYKAKILSFEEIAMFDTKWNQSQRQIYDWKVIQPGKTTVTLLEETVRKEKTKSQLSYFAKSQNKNKIKKEN